MNRLHTALFALVALASTACAAWQPELAVTYEVSAAALMDALQVVNTRH